MGNLVFLRLTISVALAMILIGASGAAKATDISGMWWVKDRSEVAKLDHDKLPFTPEGEEEY